MLNFVYFGNIGMNEIKKEKLKMEVEEIKNKKLTYTFLHKTELHNHLQTDQSNLILRNKVIVPIFLFFKKNKKFKKTQKKHHKIDG